MAFPIFDPNKYLLTVDELVDRHGAVTARSEAMKPTVAELVERMKRMRG